MNAAHRPILVVGGNSLPGTEVAAWLQTLGYGVAASIDEAAEALPTLRRLPCELVVIDESRSSDLPSASLARAVVDETGVPVVFFGHATDRVAFHRLREVDPFGFLFLPLQPAAVQVTLDLAFHRLDKERERMLALPGRLAAHAHLHAHEALLPVCAGCKRIPTHEGRWMKLEEYFARHAGVQFTHSLCPECEQRLYSAPSVSAGTSAAPVAVSVPTTRAPFRAQKNRPA